MSLRPIRGRGGRGPKFCLLAGWQSDGGKIAEPSIHLVDLFVAVAILPDCGCTQSLELSSLGCKSLWSRDGVGAAAAAFAAEVRTFEQSGNGVEGDSGIDPELVLE